MKIEIDRGKPMCNKKRQGHFCVLPKPDGSPSSPDHLTHTCLCGENWEESHAH